MTVEWLMNLPDGSADWWAAGPRERLVPEEKPVAADKVGHLAFTWWMHPMCQTIGAGSSFIR